MKETAKIGKQKGFFLCHLPQQGRANEHEDLILENKST